jgi:hypothetical protein
MSLDLFGRSTPNSKSKRSGQWGRPVGDTDRRNERCGAFTSNINKTDSE